MKMIWAGDVRSAKLSKWLYFAGTVVLAIAMVILLLTVARNCTGRFVKDWQYIADAFLDAESSSIGIRGSISRAVRAKSPDIFRDKLAFMTFGEGMHFAVHRQPGEVIEDYVSDIVTFEDIRTSRRPLPYPPQLLWCLYLEHEGKEDAVIFLGYHKDMYSAEWIVHTGEQMPFSAEFLDLLSQLGCMLPSLTG